MSSAKVIEFVLVSSPASRPAWQNNRHWTHIALRQMLTRVYLTTPRRGKFQKGRYRVTNWPAYNEGLRLRGDLTIWVSAQEWMAARRQTRGGQRRYSDLAIEMCLTAAPQLPTWLARSVGKAAHG